MQNSSAVPCPRDLRKPAPFQRFTHVPACRSVCWV